MTNTLKKMGALLIPLALYGFISTGHIPVSQPARTEAVSYFTTQYHPIQSGPEIELTLLPEATEPTNEQIDDPEARMPRGRQLRIALARVCVSESGFQIATNDCRLIFEALRTRGGGRLSVWIMKAYAKKAFDRNRTDPRKWIPFLNDRFFEPRHWTETVVVPWSSRRQAFISVYNYASHLISTNPQPLCGVRIDHWGARGFKRRQHLREGWTLVRCGETRDDFWTMPDRPVNNTTQPIVSVLN